MNSKIFKSTISDFDITGAFEAVDLLFERSYMSVSCSEKHNRWIVDILNQKPPEDSEIFSVLAEYKNLSIKTEELKEEDWLKKCFENFKPIIIGNYYIYGPHLRGERYPENKIPIEIAAATAFGTGEHPTTASCLMACQTFFDDRRHHRALDIGCGSGILSIALAKLGAKDVTACDIDPESVKISTENFKINKVTSRASVFLNKNDEFASEKYDFIVANILAEPLISMSNAILKSLTKNGLLVLSGFTADDDSVLKKYTSLELSKKFEYKNRGWSTVVLENTAV